MAIGVPTPIERGRGREPDRGERHEQHDGVEAEERELGRVEPAGDVERERAR